MWIALLAFGVSFGQVITNYAFTASSGTFTPITGGTAVATLLDDDAISAAIPIGFTFYFMGVPYTNVYASSNGFLSFKSTATSSWTNALSTGTARPLVAPFWDDLGGTATGAASSYTTTGTAGNMVFTFEWLNWARTGGSTPVFSMQVKLYEATGVIEFVYRQEAGTATPSASIGLAATATGAGNYLSLNDASAAPTVSSTTETSSIAAFPATGQIYTFSQAPGTPADPTTLTFSAVSGVSTTVNWVDNSSSETYFIITRATDAAFTQNVVTSTIASTTIATTGTAYNSVATGLFPNTTYYYKIQAANESSAPGTGLTGSQQTLDGIAYYWVGTTGGTLSTTTNWNTAADGTGTARTTSDVSDILIVDGDGIVSGGTTTINVDVASFSLGQFKVTSNTNLTLQSSAVTTRTITLLGGSGTDFVIENGCTLNLNNATMAVAFAFSGINLTGDISGTYNAGGSTSNVINTTGGTGTLVTVNSTGIINNSIVGSSGCLTGSVATLSFANGSNYTHGNYTTSNGYIPLATWGATSNIFITGGTSSTAITNAPGQTLGNFTYNSSTSTSTCSAFTSSTATVIQGNLTILASNTGKFRIVTTGTLTINGNLVVSGGLAETSNNTGTIIVLGNVSVSGGTFDVAFASTPTLKVAGNFIQTGGNITQTSTNGLLEFNGTSAQTLTVLLGVHGTNAINVKINNAAGVNLTSNLSIRNLTVTNGSLDGAGVLTYNGTSSVLTYNGSTGIQVATAVEFPAVSGPSSLTINNSSTYPNNTVLLPFSRRLNGTSGILTLTDGLLSVSTNVLSVSNTATTAISGGSDTSYVFGGLERDLPASLATGTSYKFPVGKSKYNPFALVNPTTNAGGIVTIKAEVEDGNCGGTVGALLQSLHSNIYWKASITTGAANFTNSLIQLIDSIKGADAIAASATVNGTYDIVGGLTITSTATSLTSTAPEATTLPGFFVMANKAAPVLSNVLITPAGNQCANVVRTVTATVTPGGGAVTSVVLNYNINGTPQTPVTMTNVSGNDWSGVIPTVTPVNATVTWNIVATDANLLVGTAIGTPYNDEPNFGFTVTASASETTVCSNSPVELSMAASNSSSTPTYTAPPAVSSPTTDEDFGNITITQGATTILNNTSTRNTLDGTIGIPTGTAGSYSNYTAFGPYSLTAGQTYNFSASTLQGFNAYDNAIGIYIDYNRDGDFADAGENVYVSAATTSGAHTETGSFLVPASVSSGVTRMRILVNEGLVTGPTMSISWGEYEEYSLNLIIPSDSVSWSDGSVTVGNTNPVIVSPATNTTYTGSFYLSGCPIVSNSVSITVNPLPSTPTANNSNQCGVAVPACSVSSTSGAPSPVFNWYDVPTGGTPLAGITGNTYTGAAISTTTYFYVAEDNGTCESERVMVTATVGAAPVLTLSNDTTVCNNSVATLSVTSLLSDYDAYTWTPVTDLFLDVTCATPYIAGAIASTVYVKSTTSGILSYTCNATNSVSQCSNVATINVTVLPSTVTATASVTEFCLSGSSSISVTPATGYVTATFQWMESTDNVTFSDIVGANALTYTTPVITDTTYYKMVVEMGAAVCTESNVVTINVNNPQVVSTTPATRCGEGTVTLNATGNTGTELHWYDVATGGMSLATGTSFTTPVLSATTSYFVSANYIGLPITTTSGAGSSTSSSTYTPFNGGYGGIKSQHLFTAAELISAGISAGEMTSVALTVTSPGTTYNGFTIQVGNTALADFTSSANIQGGLTTVYSSTSETPVVGVNTYTFSTPFVWDGVSNIIVSFSWSNGNTYNTSSTVEVDPTTNYSSQSYRKDSDTPANILAFTGNASGSLNSSQNRPKMTFETTPVCSSIRTEVIATVTTPPAITVTATPATICLNETTDLEATSSNTGYSYIWEPGTLSGATQTVTPTGTTTYNVTASDNSGGANDGCVATGSVLVTVNPIPTNVIASASDSSICLGSAFDLSSSATSGADVIINYNEGFEAWPPADWTFINAGTGNNWASSTSFHTGASGMSYSWNSTSPANAWGITGSQSLQAGTQYTISFWYKTGSTYAEKMKVTVGTGATVSDQSTVLWDNAGGTQLLTSTWTQGTVTYTPTVSDDYYFGFNCYSDANMYVLYIDDVSISGSTLNPATYSWTSSPAGYTSAVQNPTGVTPSVNTQYIVTAQNIFGCVASDDVAVTVNPIPVVNLGADQTICDTTTITLDAGNAGSTYTWSTGGTTQTEDILGSDLGVGANTVTVDVTSAAGCTGTGSVVITVTVCSGIEDPSMQISYYPNPATNMLNLDLSELPTGDYRFELLNMQGQKVMDKILVNDGNVISVNLMDIAPGSYVISVSGNNNTFRNYLSIQE